MNIEVKINQAELRRLHRSFLRIKNETLGKPSLRRIYTIAAKPMVKAIQSRAPYLTGALKRSIGIIPYLGSKRGSVFIGVRRNKVNKKVTTWYGRILEYGSKYIKKGKFAFFEPAVRATAQQVANLIINNLQKAIQRYGN